MKKTFFKRQAVGGRDEVVASSGLVEKVLGLESEEVLVIDEALFRQKREGMSDSSREWLKRGEYLHAEDDLVEGLRSYLRRRREDHVDLVGYVARQGFVPFSTVFEGNKIFKYGLELQQGRRSPDLVGCVVEDVYDEEGLTAFVKVSSREKNASRYEFRVEQALSNPVFLASRTPGFETYLFTHDVSRRFVSPHEVAAYFTLMKHEKDEKKSVDLYNNNPFFVVSKDSYGFYERLRNDVFVYDDTLKQGGVRHLHLAEVSVLLARGMKTINPFWNEDDGELVDY